MQRRLFLGAAGASVLSACTVTGFSSGKTETPVTPATAVLPPTTQPATQPVRIGLALGGGAARGFAHIGVIKMLEAQGIQIDFITGTSAGSVVAAIYASGMSGLEMNRMALKMDEAMIADWALPFGTRFGGWLKGEALEKYINRLVKQKTIEQMRIPLGIVATDLASGKPILFRRGNTGQAVRASCSIPGVFQPVTISGRQYVDGGLVAPVPVTYVKQMGATFVIAVNISADPANQAVSGQASMLLQTTAIMGQSISKTELAQADVVITPSLPFVKGSDFTARNEAILAGEQAAQAAMPLLREKLHLTQTIVGTPLPPH
ncbi:MULTISPECIES: patatin-like phospholipase family protein [Ralstonia]|jgi:NTE family protein|uniref:PNPLA domain-containing protein n=2 Tax=Ralstonia TaxID=48736 RepID=A0AAD2C1F9_9RALS|nr:MULTISPECIES: patatin-like phospholipase family protein [Ralstonia]MBB0026782.1 patatin-like phospholipase family protein [Ralstonia pickettii]MBB0037472.1 patatin-like phospholipase family protein [Ralstonia pickettii]MBB0099945.1 patatin-like phospholipase family protein [Ralstonia pickettii]MBB0109806.1 patatin-like phospholipase family protein [Ralstonia pickettii]MBB0130884.1 patatin-like phospholipase family protein [Ralstonia pickettii]